MVGAGAAATTVMTCWQVALLLQSSVAVQVRVIVVGAGQGPPATLSMKVTFGVASQLSIAVALPVALGAVEPPQAIVIFPGQVSTGGVASGLWVLAAMRAWISVALKARG
jgi:hypothetical protein